MQILRGTCGVALLLLCGSFRPLAVAQAAPPPGLRIVTAARQGGIVGQRLRIPLRALGGSEPYTWRLAKGTLPPGVELRGRRPWIAGVPTAPGVYSFTVAVSDASTPALQTQIALTLTVISGLTIGWKQPPEVHGNAISGSVVVRNQTGSGFELTVIVVAVNEIGRATTLGYKHFNVRAQSESQEIPFSATPGAGSYAVHADAVAHAATGAIFRARKQTAQTMTISQP